MTKMKYTIVFFTSIILFACGEEKHDNHSAVVNTNPEHTNKVSTVATPVFDADSAYGYVAKQVDFGPRVPNTAQHDSCAEWFKRQFEAYGFNIISQKGKVRAFTGAVLPMENIIAQWKPEEKNRIMLCAHWDTRPFADRDSANQNKPILGANDGGSGVGVLIEIARQISLSDPKTGVDIILFDVEDYGAVAGGGMMSVNSSSDSWCLGSQYWAKNPPVSNYRPRYGILLDMVGAEDATFPKEGISRQYASGPLNSVWNVAEKLGYGDYFVKKMAPPITDDHTYINELTNIPTIDIIHYAPRSSYGNFDFGKFHHTHNDNMDVISKKALKAVGQTLLEVIYQKI